MAPGQRKTRPGRRRTRQPPCNDVGRVTVSEAALGGQRSSRALPPGAPAKRQTRPSIRAPDPPLRRPRRQRRTPACPTGSAPDQERARLRQSWRPAARGAPHSDKPARARHALGGSAGRARQQRQGAPQGRHRTSPLTAATPPNRRCRPDYPGHLVPAQARGSRAFTGASQERPCGTRRAAPIWAPCRYVMQVSATRRSPAPPRVSCRVPGAGDGPRESADGCVGHAAKGSRGACPTGPWPETRPWGWRSGPAARAAPSAGRPGLSVTGRAPHAEACRRSATSSPEIHANGSSPCPMLLVCKRKPRAPVAGCCCSPTSTQGGTWTRPRGAASPRGRCL